MDREREGQLLKAVLKRATIDSTFRQQLLTDPRSAIEQVFGIKIPAQYRLRFIERGPDTDALIVLPDFDPSPDPNPDDPLSDDSIDNVVGGAREPEWTWSDEPKW